MEIEVDSSIPSPLSSRVEIHEYCEKLCSNATHLCARCNNRLIGLISIYINNYNSRIGYISLVHISNNYRKYGIATKLLNRMFHIVRDRGFFIVDLEVDKTNIKARNLYDKFHFWIKEEREKSYIMRCTMTRYAPIVVSVYDRLDHLKRCVEALKENSLAKESTLYIVSDAAYCEEHVQRIKEVRSYIESIEGFMEVNPVLRKKNMGGHKSITSALQMVLEQYDSFISLEDDIMVSKDFLQFMNDALEFYKDDKHVYSICGFKAPFNLPENYSEDVYFYPCNSPWGIATWKDRWVSVNHDYFDRYSELKKDPTKYKAFVSVGFYIKGILKSDSKKEIVAGDLRVYYHMFQHNMYSVFPIVSKTQNWGFDGSGEHCNTKKAWWAKPELDTRNQPTRFIPFNGYDKELLKNHRAFQDKINGGILAKWLKYTWVHRLYNKLKTKLA
ncbi:GNAT family N-acetyltransferase [Parabacteroides sp.]|uniref:GNAT family N-acetyltransferase n=1 Tax=Parabacteroides sp. TaxID=1869337 RepID=UPI0026E02D50|nr:GNAT family N-acetyltransferase [Parabacteroides sp.]MDO5429831.1 GNAT family N-acetyltransferase [Parabacteroides sp.]